MFENKKLIKPLKIEKHKRNSSKKLFFLDKKIIDFSYFLYYKDKLLRIL